jgi:hypothetical protein
MLWSMAIRAPLFNLDGPDESFFTEVARLWATGHPPYLTAFDVKPPGFFAVLVASQSVFGANLIALRALSVLSDGCAAVALLAIGRRLGAPRGAVFAALMYPVLSAWIMGNDCYPVLTALEALAFAAALGPLSPLARASLSGLAIGAAISVKQTAALEAVALLATIVRGGASGDRRLAASGAFCLGAAAIPLAFVAYFAAVGGLPQLVADAGLAALQRPGVDDASFAVLAARAFTVLLRVGPLAPLAVVVALARRSALARARPIAADAVALWFAAALIEILLHQIRWLTYLGPLLPSALILTGAAAERLAAPRGSAAVALAAAALAASILTCAFPVRIAHFLSPFESAATADATRTIAARAPEAGDRLLAIDFGGWLNVTTGLAPPTPFFHRLHLLCRFPGAGPERLDQALAAKPRFVVRGRFMDKDTACADSSALARAVAALTTGYDRIGVFSGAAESYELYEARRALAP